MSIQLSLEPLLEAKSIAVVGASADPLKVGGRPLDYLRRFGYRGRLVAVNPNRNDVQGICCFPSLSDTDPVDLAIIAAPAAGARESVKQCIAAGAKAMVLFTAGFAEVSDEGRAIQLELAREASAAGAVLLGPNCLGTINMHNNLAATFTTALDAGKPLVGEYAYVGQSGALGAYWIEKMTSAGIGVSKWISTGNEAQITLADAILYLARDRETRVICAYIEDVKRPEVFAEAVAVARKAGKAILAIKSGRSTAGQRAVAAHTGVDAGDDIRYQALLDECGVVRVGSLSEMVDVSRLLRSSSVAKAARRIGIVTISGGAGALICDAVSDADLGILELPESTSEQLRLVLPEFVRCQNPIDVTGALLSNAELLSQVLLILSRCEECEVVVLFLGAMSSIRQKIVNAVTEMQRTGKPLVLIWMGAMADTCQQIEQLGIPVFSEITVAIRALAATVGAGRSSTGAIATRSGSMREDGRDA